MIFRKPYALFIKYFKILHVIMAVFIGLLLYRSYVIYDFFRMYSIDYRSVINVSYGSYLNLFHFFYIFLILIITGVLLFVMFYKGKPKKIYIYNFIIYILILILYYFCFNSLDSSRSVILDIKVSKAFRDLFLLAFFFQVLSFVMTLVRATGFDIKHFDFGTDLQQLNISEEDSEEIEVSLEFDGDEIRRNFKQKIRNFKYAYFEHKFIINLCVLVFVCFIVGLIYFRTKSFREDVKIGNYFNISNYSLAVLDSYLLENDASGNNISGDDGAIVAVRIKVKGFGNKLVLNKGIINLFIDGLSYGINMEHAKALTDIGTAYTNQILSDDYETYIVAFEIAEAQSRKKIELKVNDSDSFIGGKFGAKNYFVRLKPKDLRKTSDFYVNKKVGQSIDFSDSVVGSTSFIINKYEINNVFKLDYRYCYADDKCIDSHEYLSATATGNYFKILMRVDGKISIDKTNNISGFYDFVSFLNSYATIYYKIDNIWNNKKISSAYIKPTAAVSDDVFIEVPYDIKDASEIYLGIKIRNQNYKYTLK